MPFIVITGQIVGNERDGFETCWSSDMEEFKTLASAKKHGFKTRGSDDFRIGQKRGEWLKTVSWMGEKFFDADETTDTAEQLGLRSYQTDPDDGCGVGWGN